jgi:hypothetical protein
MTLRKHLALIGFLVGIAALLDVRRRPRVRRAPRLPDTPTAAFPAGASPRDDRTSEAGVSREAPAFAGIADVDPQPLTQVAAEALDPDATARAHDDIPAQRDRLPVRGKNLP